MTNIVYYEQPLNERIRTFLRLEQLFGQVYYHLQGLTLWDTRAAVSSLIDILTIFGRSDLKTELLKEIERHSANLERMRQNPAVDHQRLSELLARLNGLAESLLSITGQLCQHLRKDEFLKSIMQRSSIPAGTCSFDLPEYHHWLQQHVNNRHDDITNWLSYFNVSRQTIDVLLQLVRYSAGSSIEQASAGFFQETLVPNTHCQLIRVAIPSDLPYYVEISGGKLRFAIRFMHSPLNDKMGQAEADIDFELFRCVI